MSNWLLVVYGIQLTPEYQCNMQQPKCTYSVQFSSVQSLGHVDSLWPHESQHARPPCPSPTPGVHSDSRPSSQWCHPAISSSVIPFSSCPQSLPAPGSFPMSQLFAWGGQSIGVSALTSSLPKKTQNWSPSEWTGWISLSPRDSQESSPTPQFLLIQINTQKHFCILYNYFTLNNHSFNSPFLIINLFILLSTSLHWLKTYSKMMNGSG